MKLIERLEWIEEHIRNPPEIIAILGIPSGIGVIWLLAEFAQVVCRGMHNCT